MRAGTAWILALALGCTSNETAGSGMSGAGKVACPAWVTAARPAPAKAARLAGSPELLATEIVPPPSTRARSPSSTRPRVGSGFGQLQTSPCSRARCSMASAASFTPRPKTCVGTRGGISPVEVECEGPDTGELTIPGAYCDDQRGAAPRRVFGQLLFLSWLRVVGPTSVPGSARCARSRPRWARSTWRARLCIRSGRRTRRVAPRSESEC